jgi:protein SCO1/2
MTRYLLAIACALAVAAPEAAAQHYAVKGMVVAVDPAARSFTASIDEIPDFMAAMTMAFDVEDGREMEGLVPGALVEFTLVVDADSSHAEQIRVVRYQNIEQDPFSASRLKLLNEIASGAADSALSVGDAVPDFTLTDQRNRQVSFSDLHGKVVAVNFVYTSCALPNFCLRLANNFSVLQQRFADRLGQDLVLLTVTFDPVHDTPEVLAGYAARWQADAAWHFLTGSPGDVQRVCRLFGVHAFPNEGLMDHSLHTVLIDRKGTLAANIEGNTFTATQLGDLTETLLR